MLRLNQPDRHRTWNVPGLGPVRRAISMYIRSVLPLAIHVGEDSSTIFVSEFESCCGYQWVNRLWRIFSNGAIATAEARGA